LQGDSLSLLQVPPLDLGQVEIIKGAASALYGASALGGVINLVSQQPKIRYREILLNASTQEAGDLVFWMVEPPKEQWAFTVLGGLHGQRRQDLDKDGWTDLPGFERGVLRPRIFWEDEKGRSFFATAGVMAENRRGGTMPDSIAPDGDPFPQGLDSRRVDLGTEARLPAGGSKIFTLRGSFSYRGETRTFGDVLERGRRLSWFTEAFVQGSAGRHLWLLGVAMQQDDYRNHDLGRFDFNFVTPGFIAQDEITLSEKLTLGMSARLDSHNQSGTFFSPRLSLLWKPTPEWTTRLSAGTGFFAPTPFVEETEETGFSRLLPLSGLVAERARSASLDTSWSKGSFELVATVFGSVIHDPVEYRFVGTEQATLVNALGEVRTWGTELLARYRKEEFLLLVTHNFTSSTEEDPDFVGRREVPLTPRHSASFNAIWEDESWGRLGFEAYYVGRQSLEYNPYRLEGRGYLLVGALAERRLGSFRVFINLENLTNVRQTRWDPLVRPVQLPDGRWTVDAWAPLDGRVINGGIRFQF
jgi:iron complex outermembrane receptor protein